MLLYNQIAVRDADVGENAKIVFKLQDADRTRVLESDRGWDGSGVGAVELFRIDPNRGTIYVNSKLSAIDFRAFLLTVVVTDSGTPPMSQAADLRVIVNQTIPFGGTTAMPSGMLQSSYGFVVVVAGSAGCFVVMVTLVVSVLVVRHRDQRRRRRKYNNRMEALKMLTAVDGVTVDGSNVLAHSPGGGNRCVSSPEVSPRKVPLQNGGVYRRSPSFEDIGRHSTISVVGVSNMKTFYSLYLSQLWE